MNSPSVVSFRLIQLREPQVTNAKRLFHAELLLDCQPFIQMSMSRGKIALAGGKVPQRKKSTRNQASAFLFLLEHYQQAFC